MTAPITITASIPNNGQAVAGFRAYEAIAVTTPSGGYGLAIPPAMPCSEARAVAHLFVGAPAMLAALEDAVDSWGEEFDNDDGICGSDMVAWFCTWFPSARAAIKAAKGGE